MTFFEMDCRHLLSRYFWEIILNKLVPGNFTVEPVLGVAAPPKPNPGETGFSAHLCTLWGAGCFLHPFESNSSNSVVMCLHIKLSLAGLS